MTQSGEYTQEQIEMVKQQATIVTDRSIKKKVASTPTKQDMSPCNPLIGWKTGNSTLPPNWKIKRHEYANQTVYFYMSPKGEIIKSRRAVMDYMFEDGSYSEKDFLTVISGAKQRKVALQELYDAKVYKKSIKRKRRSKSNLKDDPEDTPDEDEENNLPATDDELDEVDDDDDEKYEDPRRSPKKLKLEKEPVLPTRRSGRIKEKRPKKDQHQTSDAEGSESECEILPQPSKGRFSSCEAEPATLPVPTQAASPTTPATPPAPAAQTEVKRKRGRPPKVVPHSFELLPGGGEQDLISDTLIKVEEKMGDSLVKLEGTLFKVELTSENDIKDFSDINQQNIDKYSDSIEIKLEETALNNALKEELEFGQQAVDGNHLNLNAKDKVTVNEFFVDGDDYSVSTKLVNDEIYSSTAGQESIGKHVDSHDSAYAVVVNVLNDIVSSISE